jgi:Mn-dependent DtxR family transcriptional regulator
MRHSGRPTKLDDGDLQAELDIEPSSSTRELAAELGVSKVTVWNHLKQLDFVHKKPRQDPHELTGAQTAKRVEKACQEFFDSKPVEWYFDHIRKLADRWQKVIDNDGLYFEE